jgi:ribosomal protein S4E
VPAVYFPLTSTPGKESNVTTNSSAGLVDGAHCTVVSGTHAGKAGTVRDINTSKTGQLTITVVQADGVRLKTLAKNVVVPGTR